MGNMNRMMEVKYVFLRTKMGRYEKDLNIFEVVPSYTLR